MDNEMQTESCDVLVIGGGPGGSTASTLLARKGWRVIMLEKVSHPRFHIGESLLPMNMPILRDLGVFDAVAEIGVVKHGADFADSQDKPGEFTSYYFRTALGCQSPHAFQVKREEFDELLFRHAAANGVDARERVTVEDVTWNAEGRAIVEAKSDEHGPCRFEARYVVDASGRDTFFGAKWKLKEKNPQHQSAAIYAHFRGIDRREGEDAGNIGIYWLPQGWGWVIPLRNGITSVGCVCWPEYLKQRRGMPNDQFLMQTLQQAPAIWGRMEKAEMASEVYIAGNYSYACKQMAGKGWIMVGDAYSFLDPVFSSGVYLAMSSARRAVAVVDGALRKPSRERALQREYARETRRGLKKFSWFIYRFTTPVIRELFSRPHNTFQIQQAVTSMLAGDVYSNRPADRRLVLFKLICRIPGIAKAA
ncbi:MAG TPA: NAD(P)/FAD-dependent oxidoreductase [Gammaproteobacteria bacterium]|nr:NAD(P)/FAD-dependent oxidoreductase [Gammaproteobacteria bacterium]